LSARLSSNNAVARRWILAALVLVLDAPLGSTFAAAPPALDLARLLDDYAAGRFDQSVRAVEQAGDAQAMLLRTQWRSAARLWVDADPATKPHRLLAVASFALETEHLRAERGAWSTPMAGVCVGDPRRPDEKSPAGTCVIEWAWSLLVERGIADGAERAWVLAAAALAGGVRDFRVLYNPMPGVAPSDGGLITDALRRHPGDARLQLEHAIATSARFSITIDGAGPAPPIPAVMMFGRGGQLQLPRDRPDSRENVIAELTALAADPDVGAESRLRLGYLLWVLGDAERARAELGAAAAAASDADLRYLAKFLRGWIALTAHKPAEAIPDLEAALQIRPHSQSAVLALAALELQRGEAGRAHELAQASLATRPDDVDPWRWFLYGHYSRMPALVANLRREVRP
jgi:tetratricopeptide (TPR) repeat protein